MAISPYTIRVVPPGGELREFVIHPETVERITLDFTDMLDSGEAVSTPTWSKIPSGATLQLLDPSLTTPNATIKVAYGAAGEDVRVKCVAPLTGGQGRTFVAQFIVRVRATQ